MNEIILMTAWRKCMKVHSARLFIIYDRLVNWVGSVNRVLGQSLRAQLQAREEKHEMNYSFCPPLSTHPVHMTVQIVFRTRTHTHTHTHTHRKAPAPDFSCRPIMLLYWYLYWSVCCCLCVFFCSVSLPHTHTGITSEKRWCNRWADADYLGLSAM